MNKLAWTSVLLGIVAGIGTTGTVVTGATEAPRAAFDPLLSGTPGGVCGPVVGGQPRMLRQMVLAQAQAPAAAPKGETAPFSATTAKASASAPSATADVPLYRDLGAASFRVGTRHARAQAYVDQGMRMAANFNHAEAIRAFQAAQKLDPHCAWCFGAEAWALGPNINVPMAPEANAPALAALQKAQALVGKAPARDRDLVNALGRRYSADPQAERATLDAAFADAMKALAAKYPNDDHILALYAEAAMDTQPWDYWEAAGAKPKGRAQEFVTALETVLARNPRHAHAIHLYIHAVEASTRPERALPHARRLAALMPGAGHIVHMPAHIYYRVGLYKDSLQANRRALRVDERYFEGSPSDPIYRYAYYPHNIHFVLVSAQMGGDAATTLEAAAKLDAALPVDVVKSFKILEPVKGAPFYAHAQFSDPDTILKLAAPPQELPLVSAMYHYARAGAFAARRDLGAARSEVAAIEQLERNTDFKPFGDWGIPAREVMQTARWVALGRVADAAGDLDAAAKAYEEAIFIEDALAYTEPPYWYYPVRQSLAAVRLRQGRLDDATQAFVESLRRVRNNGWALAGLAETYRQAGKSSDEKTARAALARTWFGGRAPDLARL
jgi:tetratricopeptide (TPR) repeat protein